MKIGRAFHRRIADHNIAMDAKSQELRRTTPYPQEVLERFLLGFPGRELSAELAGLLANGLAGVALYPRNFRHHADYRNVAY